MKSQMPFRMIVLVSTILLIFMGCKPSDISEKNLSIRKTTILSENWKFQVDIKNIGENEQWYSSSFNRDNWNDITVPQAWDLIEAGLWGYEGLGWYSRIIKPDEFTSGKKIQIIFNRVMYYTRVWINGNFIGENIDGYLPFSFDISKFLEPGKDNFLVIRVDNKPRIEWLPASPQIEWIQYGGILEPVQLVETPYTYINDLTIIAEPNGDGANIQCIVDLTNETGTDTEMEIGIEIYRNKVEINGNKAIERKNIKVSCKANDTASIIADIPVEKADPWSPESPALYVAKVTLIKDGKILDDKSSRFGIRKVVADGKKILLNGKQLILKGVNRYDEYGKLGPNPTEEMLRKELSLMKSVGINTIRVHYPQSSDLLSLYDEYGFVMIEELPLNWWGWYNGPQSLDILNFAKPELRKMIGRDKNHPCVIIWSMANECSTTNEIGITVMRELLRLAKSLDKTRLVTFVCALDPDGHLAYDEADIVAINMYNGIFAGKPCRHINQIDSLGFMPLVSELTHHRNSISNKPIIITEFGAQGITNIHGDVCYTEEFQAAYIEKIWEGISSVEGVSGGVLWCWADYYHRKYLITYNDYGPYGVVSVDRKPKKALEAIARMYGGK